MKIRPLLIRLSFFVAFSLTLTLSTRAHAQMSETEKKAAARAAFQEGVKLQDDGKAAEALSRFDAAEKLFDAPTHLLHIAECQALTGRLVESAETYELLAHKQLGANAPDVFVQAQTQGAAEEQNLRPRIPTLRVSIVTKPPNQQVQNLSINVNGVAMPVELVGIARPLNPGTYRFSAQASGLATSQSIDVPLGEKEQKSIELVLVRSAGGPPPVVIAPPGPAPAPYVGAEPRPKRPGLGTTSTGFLFGVRGGGVAPGGSVVSGQDMNTAATTGFGLGFDGYVRLVKMMLIGLTFEHGFLNGASSLPNVPSGQQVSTSAYSNYFGVSLGILPSVDHFSFIGDIGVGSRSMGFTIDTNSASYHGLEFDLSVGMSIPAGPIRIVPRLNLGIGSFSSQTINGGNSSDLTDANRATHVFAFFGLAAYYSLDVGPKPE